MTVTYFGRFRDHRFGGDLLFAGGLESLGFTVRRVEYRAADRDELVASLERTDLVVIGKGDGLDPSILDSAPGSEVLVWYGDWRPTPESWLTPLARRASVMFVPYRGYALREFHAAIHSRRTATYVHPCLSDAIVTPSTGPRPTPLVFTGTRHRFMTSDRESIIDELLRRRLILTFGWPPQSRFERRLFRLGLHPLRRRVRGDAYAKAMARARLGLSISATNTVPLYTSDRLMHLISFGALPLVQQTPDLSLVFESEALPSFQTLEDLVALRLRWLRDDDARIECATRLQNEALARYSPTRMVELMLAHVGAFDLRITSEYRWYESIG